MKLSGAVIGCSLLVLSGCFAKVYKEPTSGPTTEVVFENRSAYELLMTLYEDPVQCTGVTILAGRGREFPPNSQMTVKFPARRMATIQFSFIGVSQTAGLEVASCIVVATFTPDDVHHYRFVYTTEDGRCKLNDRRASIAGEWEQDPTFIPRKPRQPFLAKDGFCEALP